jgi:DNA-binding IclR family transcriptional regulator
VSANGKAILKALVDKPGESLTTIADTIGTTRQNVCLIARRLAGKKLLAKTGRGKYDPTPEGRAIVYPEALP